MLGSGTYAIPVQNVAEVLPKQPIVCVPKSPKHILGIINLRGEIVTVADARSMFGLGETSVEEVLPMIVVSADFGGVAHHVAICVDAMGEVAVLDSGQIQPINEQILPSEGHFFRGTIEHHKRFVLWVIAQRLFVWKKH